MEFKIIVYKNVICKHCSNITEIQPGQLSINKLVPTYECPLCRMETPLNDDYIRDVEIIKQYNGRL